MRNDGERPTGRRGRVLAVDDHVPFLALLHKIVAATDQLELVGAVESGEQAIEAARKLRPDLVLIDVHMPGIGGVAAARQIKEDRPSTHVVFISTTHPEARPLADAIIWKSHLEPKLLDDIWLRCQLAQ
jgi:DNA-binding NarL/FixJ family response regulator